MVHHKLEKCGSIIKNNLKFVKDNSGKSTSTHKIKSKFMNTIQRMILTLKQVSTVKKYNLPDWLSL